jgi:hypothetical protein
MALLFITTSSLPSELPEDTLRFRIECNDSVTGAFRSNVNSGEFRRVRVGWMIEIVMTFGESLLDQ